eukprot:m.14851 g.14851  ORF g.14851 m.14851 type:complete len:61 (+) comp6443_c0_seq1:4780-4962(+)
MLLYSVLECTPSPCYAVACCPSWRCHDLISGLTVCNGVTFFQVNVVFLPSVLFVCVYVCG